MRNLLIFLTLTIVNLCCSQQPEIKKIGFQPELTIGENTEIDGAWFSSLNDFYVDEQGRIYCVDGNDKKIKMFDESGKPLFQFGQKGQGPGEFSFPNAIVISRDGEIYVSDLGHRNISKFTTGGKFISSVKIGMPVVRLGVFDSGNLLVEIARIDRRQEISRSIFELRLFNANLKPLKKSIYEKPVEHYAWVTANDQGQAVTQMIPYAPRIVWNIIGDKLYVGYNAEFKISVFDDNGNLINEIRKDVDHQKVPVSARDEWIETTVQNFTDRPGFVPSIIKKSMKQVVFPKFMPVFTSIVELADGFVVFGNPRDQGIPGILFNKNDEEIGKAFFEFDGFKYFYGRYYRVVSSEEEPVKLIRYSASNYFI